MRVLGPIVQAPGGAVFDIGYDLLSLRAIGSKLVEDNLLRFHALLLQQSGRKTPCLIGVAARSNDLVDNDTLLADGPPQPVLFANDTDHHLIKRQMSFWSGSLRRNRRA